MLNDEDDEGELANTAASNLISLSRARLELTRHLVTVIYERHRVLKRYPVLAVLAEFHGWEPEALGKAYLGFLRRDLNAVSEPRTRAIPTEGSAVALSIVEGHPEGP